ncbi:MAG: ribosome maturation factor RimM [Anaerovorax sp.]
MGKIKIGQIVNVVGLKGEVKVYHFSDYKERFEELTSVYIENKPFQIEKIRYMKEMVILKLEGISDRTQAESYKGKELFIDESDKRVLPKDTYYIDDLIGLTVVDQQGEKIGHVSDVIQNAAQDLYEIEMENKNKCLIPAVGAFILNINIETKTMTVRLIDGLLEL